MIYNHLFLNRNAVDTTNFSQYPESDNDAIPIRPEKDPFLDWNN